MILHSGLSMSRERLKSGYKRMVNVISFVYLSPETVSKHQANS